MRSFVNCADASSRDVQITVAADGSGAIEEVEPRKRAIVRLDPRPRGDYQQILLANLDQAVFIFACAHPDPKLRMLDRFLVIAEKQKVPPIIVANKTDLVEKPKDIFGLYEPLGYRVIYTSASTGAGVEELRDQLGQQRPAHHGCAAIDPAGGRRLRGRHAGLEIAGVVGHRSV